MRDHPIHFDSEPLMSRRASGLGGIGQFSKWLCRYSLALGLALPYSGLGQVTFLNSCQPAPLEVAGWGSVLALSLNSSLPDTDTGNFGQVVSTCFKYTPLPLKSDGSSDGINIVYQAPPTTPGTASVGNKFSVQNGSYYAVSLAAGEFHTLVLQNNGKVIATGWNGAGQTNVPAGLDRVVGIAAGVNHSLALRDDGTVVAWGLNQDGQCDVPADVTNVIAIAAGRAHSMALVKDGTVRVWGSDVLGQTTLPADLKEVVSIASGADHCLALLANGTVRGWGADLFQQATPPVDLTNVVALAGGSYFSLALKNDGRVFAWGDPRYGATEVPGDLTDVKSIAAGDYHALALKRDGTVVSWGQNSDSLGKVPSGLQNVVAITAGGYHSQALVAVSSALSAPRLEQGRFALDIYLPAGERYELQASRDLVEWTSVKSGIAVPGDLTFIDSDLASSGCKFFRLNR